MQEENKRARVTATAIDKYRLHLADRISKEIELKIGAQMQRKQAGKIFRCILLVAAVNYAQCSASERTKVCNEKRNFYFSFRFVVLFIYLICLLYLFVCSLQFHLNLHKYMSIRHVEGESAKGVRNTTP